MKKRIGAVIGLMTLLLSVGCSASSSSYSKGDYATKEESIEMGVTEDYAETNGSDSGVEINTDSTLNRKIIKTGYLSIESKTFNESVQKLMQEIEAVGGFMQNCYIEGDEESYRGSRYAELTARIPKDKFDTFMNQTDAYGNVLSKKIEGKDVTDQYFDAETHLTTLEIRKERLQTMLKESGSLEELFTIEKELADVVYEIERLQGTLNQYDSLIDFATIEISVQERYEYKEKEVIPVTLTEKIANQFKQSCKGVKEVAEGVLLVITALIPFVILLGLPVLALVLIIIFVCKKVSKKKPTQKPVKTVKPVKETNEEPEKKDKK